MERFGSDFKKVNLDNVLGPIIQSNILKNKSFLLTCTIPIKATTNGTTNGTTNERQVCIRFSLFSFRIWLISFVQSNKITILVMIYCIISELECSKQRV